MDEKVEAFAKDIVRSAGLDVYGKAEYFMQQGYRKVNDTAREIFEEIDSVKEIFPNDIVGYNQAQGWLMCIDKLKEICTEKYGVEWTEEEDK